MAAGQLLPLGSVAETSTSTASGAAEHSKASGRATPAARQVKVLVEASAREQSSETGALLLASSAAAAALFVLSVPLSESSAAAKALEFIEQELSLGRK